jgi:hypothetical protein
MQTMKDKIVERLHGIAQDHGCGLVEEWSAGKDATRLTAMVQPPNKLITLLAVKLEFDGESVRIVYQYKDKSVSVGSIAYINGVKLEQIFTKLEEELISMLSPNK